MFRKGERKKLNTRGIQREKGKLISLYYLKRHD
jgi:hypothetical protein